MCIVINDGDSAHLTFFLKPSVRARKLFKAGHNRIKSHSQFHGNGNGCKGIIYIVFTGHSQCNAINDLSLHHQVIGWPCVFVIGYILCRIGAGSDLSKSHHPAL